MSCECDVRLLNHIMPNEFIWLHCIQLYLLDFLYLGSTFPIMNNAACTSFNVTGNQLMGACPECGNSFTNNSLSRKLRVPLGIIGLVALASVIFL